MASEIEEIVIHPHTVDAKQLLPDRCHGLLRGSTRRNEVVVGFAPALGGRRQGASIDLAVGRQREAVRSDDVLRNHVVGERAAQMVAQFARVHLVADPRHYVGHEPRIPRVVLTEENDGLRHRLVRVQRGLNLAQLDAEPAQLDLVVEPPEKLDTSVWQVPGRIASAVQTRRLHVEGIRDESLGGEVRAVQVPARQADTAYV